MTVSGSGPIALYVGVTVRVEGPVHPTLSTNVTILVLCVLVVYHVVVQFRCAPGRSVVDIIHRVGLLKYVGGLDTHWPL